MQKPEDFIKAYETALAAQDWDRIAPLIHEDCVATFTEATFRGKSEVEGAFKKTFALIRDEVYRLEEIQWLKETDDFAVLTYTFHWSGLIDGKPASGSGRGTSVLVREGGRWLLLAEHLGPPPR
ncbi:MAG TPA: nuclear transport factor 2 family protein [Anaerolineales bacterium]|nr:nuclear transport factor 2 family protein [Anaerolineales bacterium]